MQNFYLRNAKMLRFFPCKSKKYASNMELHLTTTINNIFGILHLKTGKKYEIYHIFVLIFHGNQPKVKVHKGESPQMSN